PIKTHRGVPPSQETTPSDRADTWDGAKTQGEGDVAQRVSARLRNDGALNTRWNGTSLRRQLDKIPLWRGDHVAVRQLVDDFARYLYLPKLKNDATLTEALADGLNNSVWMSETYALADAFDGEPRRYRGLIYGQHRTPTLDQLVVKPDVAMAQITADRVVVVSTEPDRGGGQEPGAGGTGSADDGIRIGTGTTVTERLPEKKTRRFYAQVALDPAKISTETNKINQEVLQHVAALYGAKVTVTLEIEATVEAGIPEGVRRALDENSRTLKFIQHGFEES
ncbi:MAG: AAA+ family ATPase, partial [Thermomicrobiales bacterium]